MFLSSSVAAQTNTTGPIVDLGYAKYAGWTNTTIGINYFRGLHYAQPPTGSLRWQKPVPIESSANLTGQTIDATSIAPACIPGYPEWNYAAATAQGSFASTPWGQNEDCLILDVLVPTSPQDVLGGLPVIVQIHGGGYTEGSAQAYPGDAMVHASNGGIIYVSIQYRLGIYGFLAGADVAANGVQNAGLYDQRLALDWVQSHIAAFGGDPEKVTIWGGSAGGGSVTYQLMAGGGFGAPPFRAAIAEYPWWQPLLNASTQELQYRYALDAAGCGDLNCLRGLSTDELTTVGQTDLNVSYPGPGSGYGTFWFGPVVDGEFLQELPDTAFKTGNYHDVPLLIDRDGYEGIIFSDTSQTTQVEETLDVSSRTRRRAGHADADSLDNRRETSSPAPGLAFFPGCISCTRPKTTTRPSGSARPGSATSSSTVSIFVCVPNAGSFMAQEAADMLYPRPDIPDGEFCH